MVMPAFRAALGVECNFCHVFGDRHERGHADERHSDGSPKKLVAPNMIGMLKEINAALFPQNTVDIVFAASSIVPEGKRYVTCLYVPPRRPSVTTRAGDGCFAIARARLPLRPPRRS
jgi:hypothetical protein